MIFTFKTKASNNVIMLEKDGKKILSILGKDPGSSKGIITIEQLPGAINAIKSAIKADKAIDHEPAQDDDEDETGDSVHLFQRAAPILEMLERSLQENEVVTWGV